MEYNFSSDTRQDKNDGSQYGELIVLLLTLEKIKLTGIQYGGLQFQFRHDKININYNQSGVLQYQY